LERLSEAPLVLPLDATLPWFAHPGDSIRTLKMSKMRWSSAALRELWSGRSLVGRRSGKILRLSSLPSNSLFFLLSGMGRSARVFITSYFVRALRQSRQHRCDTDKHAS
jgi:hypothetical protein